MSLCRCWSYSRAYPWGVPVGLAIDQREASTTDRASKEHRINLPALCGQPWSLRRWWTSRCFFLCAYNHRGRWRRTTDLKVRPLWQVGHCGDSTGSCLSTKPWYCAFSVVFEAFTLLFVSRIYSKAGNNTADNAWYVVSPEQWWWVLAYLPSIPELCRSWMDWRNKEMKLSRQAKLTWHFCTTTRRRCLEGRRLRQPCPILGASKVDFGVAWGLQLSSLLGCQTGAPLQLSEVLGRAVRRL